jgi:uncharacterized membrane protein YfcA
MSYSPTPLAYVLLVPTAAAAGFVDAIAGGGGIITIPALLAAGLPPHLALGTNKLQASIGTLAATIGYRKAGLFTFRELLPGIAATALGAALGAAAVGAIDSSFLKVLIPILLVGILVFLALKPRFGLESSGRKLPLLPFWIGGGLALGFYDGFFGPGTGTFWSMALVGLAGYGLKEATGRAKVANLVSGLFSLGVFLAAGSVIPLLGLAMGAAQAVGAYVGSRMVVAHGAGFVRVVLIAATAAMVVYIVLKYWVL